MLRNRAARPPRRERASPPSHASVSWVRLRHAELGERGRHVLLEPCSSVTLRRRAIVRLLYPAATRSTVSASRGVSSGVAATLTWRGAWSSVSRLAGGARASPRAHGRRRRTGRTPRQRECDPDRRSSRRAEERPDPVWLEVLVEHVSSADAREQRAMVQVERTRSKRRSVRRVAQRRGGGASRCSQRVERGAVDSRSASAVDLRLVDAAR